MGLRDVLGAVRTRLSRVPDVLAAGASVDHPSNGGITGDLEREDGDGDGDSDERRGTEDVREK